MGDTKIISAINIQKGNYAIIEGSACRVVDVQISRPGKHGHSKVRISAIGLVDDKKRIIVVPGHDNIEVPLIGKRTAQVLSILVDKANVMDSETYETFDLVIPDELKGQVVEGVSVVYWVILNDKVMKQIKGGE